MHDWQLRVIEEKKELDHRLAKLVRMKYTNLWAGIPHDEQERLNTQGHHMCAYSAILGERIRNFT